LNRPIEAMTLGSGLSGTASDLLSMLRLSARSLFPLKEARRPPGYVGITRYETDPERK
jgi:hypothetical protein